MPTRSGFPAAAVVIMLLVSTAPALAQTADGPLPPLDGPPPPVAPAVVSRDAEQRATIRAVRVEQPLRIDGALDEAIYRDVRPVSGLIQIEPRAGDVETEPTEFWVAFDDTHIYYAVRSWEPDLDRLVATEMRRDNNTIFSGNDVVAVTFDTFYDRRNGFAFNVNPLGGRQDGQVTNNRQFNADFNPIWEVKTGRFEGGWILEAAIPFKSLRYRPGRQQIWGFNLMRARPGRNEIAFLQPMPPGRGRAGMTQISLGATIVGIEAPPPARNVEIKPYVTSSLTTERLTPRPSDDAAADVGGDLKLALTEGLTLDLTVNTDFAQVEADEQQINLTRFSLFFPEKRDFFLENGGVFSFGGVAGAAGGASDAPILFYSRRIGLDAGQLVPLHAGGRVTGRAGRYTVGLVNIQTGESDDESRPSTNYSVVRLKRDILRRSAVGVMATNRSAAQLQPGAAQAYGVDGTFTFYQNVNINSSWAVTRGGARRGDDSSYRLQFDYPADRYGVQLERLGIGENFNPEVGFVRRPSMQRSFAQLRFSPRPRADRAMTRQVRRFSYIATIAHIENGAGQLESRERSAEFAIELQNTDRFHVAYNDVFELLPQPFRIAPGVVLPIGGYGFGGVEVGYNMGIQRPRGANFLIEYGDFYSGQRLSVSASRGRVQLHNQLSVEPSYSMNDVRLPEGRFRTHLAGGRVTYTMTPLMFVSALVQFNAGSSALSANARLRWEYRPGSELFIVYNEQRDTRMRAFPDLANRTVVIKVNRLFRL